jgi:sigma-B regulation protein RsbU (phosphoserine phosphatase)
MSATDEAYFAALLEDDADLLYDRAPCGYLTTSSDGTIRKANTTFLQMTGYSATELLDVRRFVDLLTIGGRIYHETHYAPLLHMTGTAREIALDVVHRDGHTLPVLVNAVADNSADGTTDRIRVAVFDATNRRAYERELLRAKEQAESSEARARALARTLQQTLIPPSPPAIPHLDVAAEYRPAGDGTEVGGDVYDVFRVGADEWIVTVGDVCGKGAAAAVITALARYTLRTAAMDHPSPAETLARLNEVMLADPVDRFCTVVLARLRRRDGGWSGLLSSAGHPLPLRRSVDGRIECVGGQGMLLGVLPEAQLQDVPFALAPGESLVLYTDGLPEGRRGDEFYGDERMHAVVGRPHPSAGALAAALLADVLEFQQGRPRDDLAVVVLRAGA